MLGRLRSTRYRTREGRRCRWRLAGLAAAAFTIFVILTVGESDACVSGEKPVEGSAATAALSSKSAPSTAPVRAAARVSFVHPASNTSPSKTPSKIGFLNCCGDPSDHPEGTSCVAGACSACCAATDVSDAPFILIDFSRDYVRPMESYSRTDVTMFLFRPPRSFS